MGGFGCAQAVRHSPHALQWRTAVPPVLLRIESTNPHHFRQLLGTPHGSTPHLIASGPFPPILTSTGANKATQTRPPTLGSLFAPNGNQTSEAFSTPILFIKDLLRDFLRMIGAEREPNSCQPAFEAALLRFSIHCLAQDMTFDWFGTPPFTAQIRPSGWVDGSGGPTLCPSPHPLGTQDLPVRHPNALRADCPNQGRSCLH